MNCPGCDTLMDIQTFGGNYGKSIVLDLCYPCGAIWFDGFENLQLTPSSILNLFKLIHEKRTEPGGPFPQPLRCPCCRVRLVHTNDRQRTTTFFYDICPESHGRFITFFQFLREKSFVRSLSPKEIAELKQKVTMLHCSNCGAGINLEKESTCSYCHSPISMLDPQQMERAVQQLQQREARQTISSVQRASVSDRLRIDSLSHSHHSYDVSRIDLFDLVWSGIDILTDVYSNAE